MIASPPLLGLAGLVGLVTGSYAVTGAIRWSRAEPSSAGRSHCDACGQTLGFAHTVPIASYVAARGTCRTCRAPIDPTHLVGEVAGALLIVTAVATFDPVRTPLLAVLGLTLLAAATIDWKIGRLPDVLTAGVAILSGLIALSHSLRAAAAGAIAAVAAFLLLQGLRWLISRKRADPGLGFGDVKLICGLALWLGAATPWMMVGATLAGLVAMAVLRPKDGRLRFGPWLAAAAWVVGMGGELGIWPTTL